MVKLILKTLKLVILQQWKTTNFVKFTQALYLQKTQNKINGGIKFL